MAGAGVSREFDLAVVQQVANAQGILVETLGLVHLVTPAIWGDFEGLFEGSAEIRRTLEPGGFGDLGQGVGGGAEELGRALHPHFDEHRLGAFAELLVKVPAQLGG